MRFMKPPKVSANRDFGLRSTRLRGWIREAEVGRCERLDAWQTPVLQGSCAGRTH